MNCPCGQPIDGATLCADCTHALKVAIVNTGVYHDDLNNLRTRQVRYGGQNGGRSADTPIGMDARFAPGGRASEVDWATRNTVTTWARMLMEEHPNASPGPLCRGCEHQTCARMRRHRWPSDSVASCVRYLLGWADHYRTHEDGPQMLDEMQDLERRLRSLIDRPADKWYAGLCSAEVESGTCPAELYARSDKGEIRCRECETVHDVQARREFLLNEAENVLATASEAARAITVWSDYDRGENRLVKRIGMWSARKRIEVRGHVTELGRQRPTYRIGDVLDLLAQDAREDAAKVGAR